MKKFNFKQLLPYLVAIVLFIAIALVYFSPLLEGKRILQSDIVQFQGMSKEIVDFREKTGQEALWTNSMFGGMPAYQISVKYTSNLLRYLDSFLTLGLPHPANYLFLYFLGFFILLLVLRVNPWLAIAGSIAYSFSSYFFIIIDAGHNSQAHAIGYIPFVLAGIFLTFRKNYLWGGILTAAALSLEVLANHPQITYYMVLLAVMLGIAEGIMAIVEKRFAGYLKAIGVIFIAAVFAVLTNITVLWATWEYGKYTIRGKSELTTEKENRTSGLDKDYATMWSYGIPETLTLMIPNFYGGSSSYKLGENSATAKVLRQNNIPEENIRQFISQPLPLYFGDQPFTSGPVYVGAIVVFLFILGLIIVKGHLKWWLLAATVLSILLAWGHNFMAFTEFFMHYIPGYNKFRAVTMILVIAEVAMPILAILALKEIFEQQQDRKKWVRPLLIAFGITGGICLIFAAFPGIFFSFTSPSDGSYGFPDWLVQGLRDDRQRLLQMDALRSLIFISLTAALLWIYLTGKLKMQYTLLILILLFLIDMFPVNKRFLGNDSFTSKRKVENPIEPSPADEQILQDKSPDFRVINLSVNPFMDATTSYFHKSIGGYHGAKFRRYQELYDHHISKSNLSVLNMLNTKYFIVRDNNKNLVAQYNPYALGPAWFVRAYRLVDNADEEINALTNFSPKDTAIIDRTFSGLLKDYQPGRDSGDFIRLEEYKPNHLVYSYRSKNPGLAVFSEIYYPKGWTAAIDGAEVPHFRANYVLRAMVLPAGEHKVVFRFHPRAYYTGEKISLYSSIALILLLLVLGGIGIGKAVRKRT
jgi:hypothetical protein